MDIFIVTEMRMMHICRMLKRQIKITKKTADLNMARSQDFRLYLQGELSGRLKENPNYSLRQFAKLLAVDPSALVKLLKGDRPIGRLLIKRFGERIGLSPDEINEFISYQERNKSRKTDSAPSAQEYQQITLDTFRLISDWHHYAILELIRVDSFVPDSRWISQALNIPISEVNFAIERMVRIGILEINESTGAWIDHTEISTNIAKPYFDGAQKKLQKQILEKAIYALEHVPVSQRDQSSMTMAIDINLLPEAKEKIKQFRRELSRFLSRGQKRNQVYHLALSLYPVSSIENEELNKLSFKSKKKERFK